MEGVQARPKFVRFAVMLGIVIALNLFFFAGRSLILPEPQFDAYCPTTLQPATTEASCKDQGGTWVNTLDDPSVTAVVKPNPEGWCDLYRTCQPEYEAAHDDYQLAAFVILVGLGILSIIVGVLPLGSSVVSSGLSYGGVLSLVIASTAYWNEASTLIQLLISVVALGTLIYLGARRFKD